MKHLFIANSYFYTFSNSFIQSRFIQIATKMQFAFTGLGLCLRVTPKPAILISQSRKTMNGYAANICIRMFHLAS